MKFLLPYDKTRIPVEIAEQNFVGSLSRKWSPTGPTYPSRS